MGSISEVLNTGQMEDIITLTEEIKDNMGEGSVNDLAFAPLASIFGANKRQA